VLNHVSLEVVPGQVTALFGPNGCGKSTLLRCMNGSLRPQTGRVLLDGQPIAGLMHRQIARRIAVVPQDTPADVPFTVEQMVSLGRYASWGLWDQESENDRRAVADSLARVGIGHLAGRFFNELSGGERQRVVIARALAQDGQVVLLDEPAAHLDIAHQLELYRLVQSLAAEGRAVLMVCHDLLIAPMFVDVAVLMAAGRIIASGSPRESLNSAQLEHAYGLALNLTWIGQDRVAACLSPN
jgi:iron complex transport system ATP-binding protein